MLMNLTRVYFRGTLEKAAREKITNYLCPVTAATSKKIDSLSVHSEVGGSGDVASEEAEFSDSSFNDEDSSDIFQADNMEEELENEDIGDVQEDLEEEDLGWMGGDDFWDMGEDKEEVNEDVDSEDIEDNDMAEDWVEMAVAEQENMDGKDDENADDKEGSEGDALNEMDRASKWSRCKFQRNCADNDADLNDLNKAYSNKRPRTSNKVSASPASFKAKEDKEAEDGSELFCLCRMPADQYMVACDGGCEDWFHGACVQISEEDGDLIDKYICE